MAIAFVDFTPQLEKAGFFKNSFESLEDCLNRANAWIGAKTPEVINVETVVLPNIWHEDGSEDPELGVSGDLGSNWYQIVRVWFKT